MPETSATKTNQMRKPVRVTFTGTAMVLTLAFATLSSAAPLQQIPFAEIQTKIAKSDQAIFELSNKIKMTQKQLFSISSAESKLKSKDASNSALKKSLAQTINVLTARRSNLQATIASLRSEYADCVDDQSSRYSQIATARGAGITFASQIGDGAEPGSQLLYQTAFSGVDKPFLFFAVDPETGSVKTFDNPATTESSAWGMATGVDGSIYVSTSPGAHFMRFDSKSQVLEDLGTPVRGEQFAWDLTTGPDGKLYGGTYPNAHLFRFDPATRRTEDLGRMDSNEKYIRYVCASKDGFIYCAVGSKQGIVAYEIATGKKQELLPNDERPAGFTNFYRAVDGSIFGIVSVASGRTYYALNKFTATKISGKPPVAEAPSLKLRNGNIVKVDSTSVTILNNGKTVRSVTAKQPEVPLTVQRLSIGGNKKVYLSLSLPAILQELNPETKEIKSLANLGNGEIYSFLPYQNEMFMAGYSLTGRILDLDLTKSLDLEHLANPKRITFENEQATWRPSALILGVDHKIYAAGLPGYGLNQGQLVQVDPATDKAVVFEAVIPNQSITSIVDLGTVSGVGDHILLLGTSINGGTGTTPKDKSSLLALWDVDKQKIASSTPTFGGIESSNPDPSGVSSLVKAKNGKVYGADDRPIGPLGGRLFRYDLDSNRVTLLNLDSSFTGQAKKPAFIYNSLMNGPDGAVWGLCTYGVFRIDPDTDKVTIPEPFTDPAGITAGGVLDGRLLYFASGPNIFSYRLPN